MRSMTRMLLVSIILLCPLVISAGEFYRYTTEDGVVIYTDDASKIPSTQIEDAQIIQGTDLKNEQSMDTLSDNGKKEDQSNKDAQVNADLKAEEERLKQMRAELDVEYAQIKAELQRLNELSQTVKGRKEIKQYNLQVDALNKRSKEYQVKQSVYVEKVDAYNKEIVTSLENE